MQNLAEVQETPLSVLFFAPRGCGVGWIDQLRPFHRSASGRSRPRTNAAPTAVQVLADVHDTALSAPTPGDGTTFQLAARAPAAFTDHAAPHATSNHASARKCDANSRARSPETNVASSLPARSPQLSSSNHQASLPATMLATRGPNAETHAGSRRATAYRRTAPRVQPGPVAHSRCVSHLKATERAA